MDIRRLLSKLTVEEKAALVSGTDFMYTNIVPRLGIPSLHMSDGPHGLRVQTEGGDNGVTSSLPATAFPTAATVASGWNPENSYRIGRAIGKEAHKYGIHVVLGPGANIKRNPTAGRNFEYFSEDPYLAGKMAAAEVNGIQSEGVGVSVKHFALNNSENYRFMGESIADMRAIREIYLKVFEIVVKESHPATMMCAYNKINGVRYFDIKENDWVSEGGEYELQLCSDSQTVILSKSVQIEGKNISPYSEEIGKVYTGASFIGLTNSLFEKMSGESIPPVPPEKPLRLESRFTDLRATFMGRILFNAVLGVARKQMKEAQKLPEGTEKDNKIKGAMFMRRILESNSIVCMSMSAGKSMPYNFAMGFVHLANGHLIKGIKCFCTKIKVPALPKEKEEKR